MTEKRYYAHKHLLQENRVHDKICHNFMNITETVEHMNNEYWKYKQLKEENKILQDKLDCHILLTDAERKKCDNFINEIKKENMELKERNYRQYKQLNQLYKLIEEEDWETLTMLNNELKENEKQLQREWECY